MRKYALVVMRRLALLLGVFVLLGLSACAVPSAPNSGKDLLTESDESSVRHRASKRLELAVAYLQEGKFIFALDNVKQAINVDPSYADAYNVRGLLYMRLNDAVLAEDSFKRALTINPQDADVLNNFGWFLCQQGRYAESFQHFSKVLANPRYQERSKTLMNVGLCQMRANQLQEAEQSLLRSFESDALNPVTTYNLATLLFKRGDLVRAQFYVRRLNNSDLANAETLWLGMKIERKLGNQDVLLQLAGQLTKRFSTSSQALAWERGAFDE